MRRRYVSDSVNVAGSRGSDFLHGYYAYEKNRCKNSEKQRLYSTTTTIPEARCVQTLYRYGFVVKKIYLELFSLGFLVHLIKLTRANLTVVTDENCW